MNEGIKVGGEFTFKLKAQNGELKDYRRVHNVVCLLGIAEIAALCTKDIASTAVAFDAIAIGLGNAAATNTQTALSTEYAKVAVTGTQVTVTSTNDTAQYVGSFAFTGAAAVVEAGVFGLTASATGVMLCRQVFAALNATSGDTLVVTYKVTFA